MNHLVDGITKLVQDFMRPYVSDYKVDVWVPTSYKVVSKRNKIILYFISDTDKSYKVSKRFSGRRTARVYGKINYNDQLITVINFTPIKPVEYITLDFTINSNGE